ncbi:hypothetical protein ACVWWG_009396 [Bradyrhizobium sp. LB7.2]
MGDHDGLESVITIGWNTHAEWDFHVVNLKTYVADDKSPTPPNAIGDTMAKKTKLVRREWTKDDVRQMKQMAKTKAGVTRIARALKRTAGATTVKAAKLGVSLSMR